MVIGLRNKDDYASWMTALQQASHAAAAAVTPTSSPRTLSQRATVYRHRKQAVAANRENIVTKLKNIMWHWICVVPDNLELQHRYMCSTARVPVEEEVMRVFPERSVAPHSLSLLLVIGIVMDNGMLSGFRWTTAAHEQCNWMQLDLLARSRVNGRRWSE